MPLDIRPDHQKIVEEILEKHVPDREVWAFGSRVNGTARETSDLDLVVIGKTPLDFHTLGDLRDAFSESDIPYKVDMVDWATISETFKEIICKDKVVIQKPDFLPKDWLYHPDFPNHWIRTPLYYLAKWINGLAFREFQFCSSGKPVIKIAEIKNGISEQTKFTNQSFDQSLYVKEGDLLFSWSGQPETSIDAFWWQGPNGWLNQHIYRVSPIENIDRIFFFYLLRYLKPNFIDIARNKQTTGLGHVTKRDLEKIEAAYPPLPEQRAIAHILGTLDDKIELNRRMNETLEAMAQALFKSWFVDFDPVRAKAEGRDTGLPKEIADLFPDGFEESELGEIPRGWITQSLSKISKITGGKQLTKDKFVSNGQIPVYGGAGFMGYTDSFNAEGFVISFGRVGAYCGQFFYYRGKAWINNNASLISFDKSIVGEWLFLTLKNLDIEPIKRGAAQPFISNSDFLKLEVLVPNKNLMIAFHKYVGFIFQKIECLLEENKTLSDIRKIILPKLLSGEIRVNTNGQSLGQNL